VSQNSNNSRSGGVSFLGALGLLFIGLKLGHVIHWSWWLVTLPLWGGAALVLAAVVAVVLFSLAEAGVKRGRR
jgi:hypothetical protein